MIPLRFLSKYIFMISRAQFNQIFSCLWYILNYLIILQNCCFWGNVFFQLGVKNLIWHSTPLLYFYYNEWEKSSDNRLYYCICPTFYNFREYSLNVLIYHCWMIFPSWFSLRIYLNQCWGAGSRDFLQGAWARAGKKIVGRRSR